MTNLNKVAAICRADSITTKTARRSLLREHGHKLAALAELERLINEQAAARRARNALLYECGRLPSSFITAADGVKYDAHKLIGRPRYYRLPLGTLEERREIRARKEFMRYLDAANLRMAAHGEVLVQIGDAPSVHQLEYLNYNIYRGSHRGRPCRVQDTTITIPINYYKTVSGSRLGYVDGLVTLSAEQLAPNIYKATWLEQGRGTSLRPVHGWLATMQASDRVRLAYHSTDSAEHARAGLAKKYKKWLIDNGSSSTESAFFKAALKNDKTIITVRHAQKFGLCMPGIRAWLANTKLDINGKAPLSEVAEWALKVPNYDATRFVTAMQIKSAK